MYHKLTDGGGSNFIRITSAALYDNEPKSGPSFSRKLVGSGEWEPERARGENELQVSLSLFLSASLLEQSFDQLRLVGHSLRQLGSDAKAANLNFEMRKISLAISSTTNSKMSSSLNRICSSFTILTNLSVANSSNCTLMSVKLYQEKASGSFGSILTLLRNFGFSQTNVVNASVVIIVILSCDPCESNSGESRAGNNATEIGTTFRTNVMEEN